MRKCNIYLFVFFIIFDINFDVEIVFNNLLRLLFEFFYELCVFLVVGCRFMLEEIY